jgi:hypothetical protein
MRVLHEVTIYPCIDIPYELNEQLGVEKILEFNPTKGLSVRHGFTQSNGGVRPCLVVMMEILLWF